MKWQQKSDGSSGSGEWRGASSVLDIIYCTVKYLIIKFQKEMMMAKQIFNLLSKVLYRDLKDR